MHGKASAGTEDLHKVRERNPCMQMQPQGLGALRVHFPLAVEVVGNHALKSHPTMPNRKRIGFVRAVMQRPNVATVPAPCRATQRQADSVPHVHIHRAVEVAASLAPKDQPTMQNTCRNGFVNIAMQRNNVPTVPALCRATQRQAHGVPHVHIHRAVEVAASPAPKDEPTMQSTWRNGFVNIAMRRNNVRTVPAHCRATCRQTVGVSHAHIHLAAEVAVRPAHIKQGTTPSRSHFGCVKHAVCAMVTRRVQGAVCNARKKVVTMSKSCRSGPAKPA